MNRLPLLVALATVACAGGGGALSQSLETQDRAPITNEGARTTQESVRPSNEGVANTTESAARSTEGSPTGGGFSCAGTYSCSVSSPTGTRNTDGVVLTNSSGGCQALDDDDDTTTLAPDGTIVQKGKVIASWTPTAGGFSYSATSQSGGQTVTITISCSKISDSTVSQPRGDDDDDSDPPTPPVVLDAGVR